MPETRLPPWSATQERIANPVIRLMTAANVWAYRLTGGRLGGTFLRGAPDLSGHHHRQAVGPAADRRAALPARRRRRRAGGVEGRHGEVAGLVPQHDGQPRRRRADRQRRRGACARAARPTPRRRALWPRLVAMYRDYDDYQARTTRNIPVMILSPGLSARCLEAPVPRGYSPGRRMPPVPERLARLAVERRLFAPGPRGPLSICLVYPNTYAVGMANLGFQAVLPAPARRPARHRRPRVRARRAARGLAADAARRSRATGRSATSTSLAFSISFETDYLHVLDVPRAGRPAAAADARDGATAPLVAGRRPGDVPESRAARRVRRSAS